jgi:hypothetical protein
MACLPLCPLPLAPSPVQFNPTPQTMKRSVLSRLRRTLHDGVRQAITRLPQAWRFALFRAMVRCDPAPDARLELKIAETQDELESCFRILHDSYVAAGFMQPDPSGLRVTIYHALPTTTTLCAKWDGHVVGTISIIREGVFGFPLQSVYDLTALRAKGGLITEVSSLAVDPAFRKTGGMVMFPLMKFMREYAKFYFDTRHLVIAVNPDRIEMYESLLCFERLHNSEVGHYDFANGAPAVGATLDLRHADERTERLYIGKPRHKNLHRYLYVDPLCNIQWPARPLHTTNDPVLTPAIMDHFFNQRTRVFDTLDERKRLLLRSIYDHPSYADVLPVAALDTRLTIPLRRHQRFSIRCPARFWVQANGTELAYPMQVIELSEHGFQAECETILPEGAQGRVEVELGPHTSTSVTATPVRRIEHAGAVYHGFSVPQPDAAWRRCVSALQAGRTHAELALAVPAVRPAPAAVAAAQPQQAALQPA